MSDRTVTAATAAATSAATEATVAAYLESWNETDPARRQAAIARAWGPRARYRDPLMAERRRRRRFAWSLGPAAGPSVVEGVDFCSLDPEGRLRHAMGIHGQAPRWTKNLGSVLIRPRRPFHKFL